MVLCFGRYNDVLAYPRSIASYAVSVRQYRILPFGFLHCCRCQQPACHLLTVRELNPPVRDFHPPENCTPVVYPKKFICIFKLFLQLTTSVRCMMLMQGTHEPAADNAGCRGTEAGWGY